jgi:hypothetical protein
VCIEFFDSTLPAFYGVIRGQERFFRSRLVVGYGQGAPQGIGSPTAESFPVGFLCEMQISHYRRVERRRSARVTLAVPLRVDGQELSGDEFMIRTHSHTVSQFGCMIPLEAEVVPDQMLVLMNEHTRQSVQCRVVTTRRHRDGKRYLGLEFLSPNSNFWRMAFSKPGARSLKQQYGPTSSSAY